MKHHYYSYMNSFSTYLLEILPHRNILSTAYHSLLIVMLLLQCPASFCASQTFDTFQRNKGGCQQISTHFSAIVCCHFDEWGRSFHSRHDKCKSALLLFGVQCLVHWWEERCKLGSSSGLIILSESIREKSNRAWRESDRRSASEPNSSPMQWMEFALRLWC